MFEVGHGYVDNVIQSPGCVEVFYDPVVLFAEGLVDAQRFLRIRFGHLEVVFCGDSVLAEFTKRADERTEQVDDSFVDGLHQHQQILHQHPECHHRTRIRKIIFVELQRSAVSGKLQSVVNDSHLAQGDGVDHLLHLLHFPQQALVDGQTLEFTGFRYS
jgi:hypothetical protein